jgi:predicted acyl esterase
MSAKEHGVAAEGDCWLTAQPVVNVTSLWSFQRREYPRWVLVVTALSLLSSAAHAQTAHPAPDIPARFETPTASYDYVKREVMIPMRDGVKLYTLIVLPRGAGVKSAPMILTRTPYNAAKRAERTRSPHMLATLPQGDEVFVADGYIRVFQDVRGKYGSEGDYVMTRPLKGPLNSSATDHSTDAYDTIDWLVKNVAESNG